MRLLNIYTLELEEFFESAKPRYYILSHRWGEKEVSYKDYSKRRNLSGPGYEKIINFCCLARRLQEKLGGRPKFKCDWAWVDTCCIDKRSSAELSEAINSMYNWYQSAETCVVYLADVPPGDSVLSASFRNSAWFRRGWTLQEILAPQYLIFCDAQWNVFGSEPREPAVLRRAFGEKTRCEPELVKTLSEVTRIPEKHFRKWPFVPSTASVAQRMSWAALRETTRIEDQAYCLLGLFDINMPLLYGEGWKAFYRLQREYS